VPLTCGFVSRSTTSFSRSAISRASLSHSRCPPDRAPPAPALRSATPLPREDQRVIVRPDELVQVSSQPSGGRGGCGDLSGASERRNAGRMSTPKVPSGHASRMSTARSQALAAHLTQLAPEITRTPGAVRNDAEDLKADGTARGHLWAAALWTYPLGPGDDLVHLVVEVATGSGRVPRVCDGMDAPPGRRCSEVRALADGSAFIHDYTALGGHQHEVRLVRSNGTQVYVGAGAQMLPGSTHDSVIAGDRVLEIAQQITVTP
jgi:hypothetical protein